jgi:hypothetical protein
MNEELVKKAEGVLVDLLDGFIKAKDFAVDQAPDIIQQLLTWKLFESILLCVLGLIIFPALVVYWKMVVKYWEKLDDWEPANFFAVVGGMVGSAMLIIVSFISLLNIEWLYIWLAPKVWLIEYAADLVK